MSDTSQGHGWWLASDGKWYPPEAWTGPPPQPAASTPSYPPGTGAAWAPIPTTAIPTTANPTTQTNGLAVASLVCSIAGIIPFFFGLPCVLGIIFGFVARARIKRAHSALGGGGLALAGIIVGFSLIGIFILLVILVAAFGHWHSCFSTTGGSNCSVN
jgi:Domain of unknown function (DUF4190)